MSEATHFNSARRGTPPEVARKRIEAFTKRFGQAHLHFAQHAAFPLVLTSDLAYRLWANFQQNVQGEMLGIPGSLWPTCYSPACAMKLATNSTKWTG